MKIFLNNCTFTNDVTIGEVSFDYDENIDNLFVGGYSLHPTDNIKNALNRFVTSLKAYNLWDKIQGMYIPLLGSTVNDSFLNVRKSFGTDNVIDSYPSGAFEMDSDNKGIKGTNNELYSGTWVGSEWYCDKVSPQVFHICVVAKEFKPSNNAVHAIFGDFKYGIYSEQIVFDNVLKNLYNNTIVIGKTEKNIKIEQPAIMCINNDSMYYYNGNNTFYSESFSAKNGEFNYYPFFSGISLYKDGNTKGIYGLKYYSYGKNMTEKEMELYYNIVDKLITSLLAEV